MTPSTISTPSFSRAQKVIKSLGQGAIPEVPFDLFKLDFVAPSPQNALVHTQAADWLNNEMTKAITAGGPLQMATGGGPKGLRCPRRGRLQRAGPARSESLQYNSARHLVADAAAQSVAASRRPYDLPEHPITVRDVLAALPAYTAQIDRISDPEKAQKIMSAAMADGCDVSKTQYRARLQLDAPKDEADTLRARPCPSHRAARWSPLWMPRAACWLRSRMATGQPRHRCCIRSTQKPATPSRGAMTTPNSPSDLDPANNG